MREIKVKGECKSGRREERGKDSKGGGENRIERDNEGKRDHIIISITGTCQSAHVTAYSHTTVLYRSVHALIYSQYY